MDWVRLVESKIRFLIQNLEKNPHIGLVHVNPQGFQQVKECKSSELEASEEKFADTEVVTVYSTLWFVGLDLKPAQNNETIDLNLTDLILNFKDISEFFLFILFCLITSCWIVQVFLWSSL